MKKRWMTRVALMMCLVFAASLLCKPIPTKAADVKVSDVTYDVTYNKATDMFVSNKMSVGSEVGTEVYMTYTVKSVDACKTLNHGVIGTGQPGIWYPYPSGIMYHNANKNVMLQEGCTYFLKFKVTEEGMDYTVIRAKGDESSYVYFTNETGKKTDKLEYFGMWVDGQEITAELTNVRFYDKNGTDLGVRTSRSTGMKVSKNISYEKNKYLDHTYTVSVDKGHALAICSNKPTTANTVYMEYKVKSSSGLAIQSGGMITRDTSKYYPYSGGNGFMIYEQTKAKESPLLQAGAEYLICMEKMEKTLDVTVQKTYNGEKTIFTFPLEVGDYITKFNYFGLWLHEANDDALNFELENVKIYDSNNNNLGLKSNRGTVKFSHSGEIEDYSGCEAVYYSEKENALVALYADQTLKYTKDGVTKTGTYSISDSGKREITLSYGEGKDTYSYMYKRFYNEDGVEFKRLGTYKATFVTGTDEKIAEQVISAAEGYVAMRPEDPKKEGTKFENWVTSDGKVFDFDTILTKSITLYAKWEGEDVRELIPAEVLQEEKTDISTYIAYGLAILLPTVSIVGCVLLIGRGGKKNGRRK